MVRGGYLHTPAMTSDWKIKLQNPLFYRIYKKTGDCTEEGVYMQIRSRADTIQEKMENNK